MVSQVAAAALRTRAAAILAAKFMLTDKAHPVDMLLSAALPAFLEHLSDPEWYRPHLLTLVLERYTVHAHVSQALQAVTVQCANASIKWLWS